MANLYYDPINGGLDMRVFKDPQIVSREDIEQQIAGFLVFRTLSDDARTLLASGGIPGAGIQGGWPDLASFDSYMDDELDRLRDILDYFDYEAGDAGLVVRTADWFTPIAVESVSDENVGEEGVLTIDEDNTTWWGSDLAGTRSIVWEVRGYKKKLLGLRLRTTSGDDRTRLQGVTIRGSQAIGMIDEPQNEIATGVDFAYDGNVWMEYTFPSPKLARYLKLEFDTSAHSSPDEIRIREIEVRVGIINHET